MPQGIALSLLSDSNHFHLKPRLLLTCAMQKLPSQLHFSIIIDSFDTIHNHNAKSGSVLFPQSISLL